MNPQQISAMIDHTLLKPEATGEAIDRLCDEAVRYGFVAVCVNPIWVARCAGRLRDNPKTLESHRRDAGATRLEGSTVPGTAVRVVSVVGFPLGANRTDTKVDEARRAVDDGASEVDMVIPLGALLGGEVGLVRDDIAAVAEATHAGGAGYLLKAILEAAALSDEQIIAGCRCAVEARADLVKTSTGFHPAGGARVEHVRLMKRHAAPLAVKASGGIRTLADLLAMVEAGATRIGCSGGPAIMDQLLCKL